MLRWTLWLVFLGAVKGTAAKTYEDSGRHLWELFNWGTLAGTVRVLLSLIRLYNGDSAAVTYGDTIGILKRGI